MKKIIAITGMVLGLMSFNNYAVERYEYAKHKIEELRIQMNQKEENTLTIINCKVKSAKLEWFIDEDSCEKTDIDITDDVLVEFERTKTKTYVSEINKTIKEGKIIKEEIKKDTLNYGLFFKAKIYREMNKLDMEYEEIMFDRMRKVDSINDKIEYPEFTTINFSNMIRKNKEAVMASKDRFIFIHWK